jgi:FtsZ-interacting cell division protein ZipA
MIVLDQQRKDREKMRQLEMERNGGKLQVRSNATNGTGGVQSSEQRRSRVGQPTPAGDAYNNTTPTSKAQTSDNLPPNRNSQLAKPEHKENRESKQHRQGNSNAAEPPKAVQQVAVTATAQPVQAQAPPKKKKWYQTCCFICGSSE